MSGAAGRGSRSAGVPYLFLERKRASSYVCVQMSWSPQPARGKERVGKTHVRTGAICSIYVFFYLWRVFEAVLV